MRRAAGPGAIRTSLPGANPAAISGAISGAIPAASPGPIAVAVAPAIGPGLATGIAPEIAPEIAAGFAPGSEVRIAPGPAARRIEEAAPTRPAGELRVGLRAPSAAADFSSLALDQRPPWPLFGRRKQAPPVPPAPSAA